MAIGLALAGTVLLAVVGIKLPGLQFQNQRVEAAYRKELVYGEDDASRASPPVAASLFGNVRSNYFRLFFHYLYFDVAKWSYLQFGVLVPYIALGPTLVGGVITLGVMQQIVRAFGRVRKRVPVPGPQLEHRRRADVRLQAAARLRAADRRRAAPPSRAQPRPQVRLIVPRAITRATSVCASTSPVIASAGKKVSSASSCSVTSTACRTPWWC